MLIDEDDVRGIVRLLGNTAALDGSHAEKKIYLMDGLCELIHADAWAWTLGCQITPGGPQVYVGFIHGGFDETRFSNMLKAIDHPGMGKVGEHFFSEAKRSLAITTMLREEVDPEGYAYTCGADELWKDADVESLMLSAFPLDNDSMSCIGLYRKVGDQSFGKREKKIAHIILSEVPWLHMSGWPDDRGATVPKLYPRQRIVLNLLLDGLDRKRIALHMGISENTVSGYTKDIYRHFGVNSQVELMRKFLYSELG